MKARLFRRRHYDKTCNKATRGAAEGSASRPSIFNFPLLFAKPFWYVASFLRSRAPLHLPCWRACEDPFSAFCSGQQQQVYDRETAPIFFVLEVYSSQPVPGTEECFSLPELKHVCPIPQTYL